MAINLKAREVIDSRGNPTVEVDASDGTNRARAIVPSGASTGVHEALELRDKDVRYGGKGVRTAVANVNNRIAPALADLDPKDQGAIDHAMFTLDATKNKSALGANAILGASMACCRLAAMQKGVPLYQHVQDISSRKALMPVPCLNVINGGVHAGNDLDMQEYMLVPAGADNFAEALRMAAETYHHLKGLLEKKYGKNSTNVGDEGGFAPPMARPEEPLEFLTAAIEELGLQDKMMIAMDPASSEMFKEGKYLVQGTSLSAGELADRYQAMAQTFPLISLEDPFDQDDLEGWKLIRQKLPKLQIVGDDLLVTNPERIAMAMDNDACNALLLKVNQIGSVTEAIAAANKSFDAGWGVMVSHRSGETEDTFIADLVVGLGAGQIKSGAPARGERTAKYNQLLRIEEESGAAFGGRKVFER
ncbi:phosphopyruvate hydratase [Candidatus Woesearchaeota archaeon CG1_02_57_44]|nr:MAG: phosphopyruvate hydratase [Candidatus Woesearchaeota archaeon CG1_02_57_44]PIN69628.1 MAG: phosphopyruvate hydratase [Candidatus Woesearchaeota archaeon CG11_big_fil_rev_8_21_14_0_20_57_5]